MATAPTEESTTIPGALDALSARVDEHYKAFSTDLQIGRERMDRIEEGMVRALSLNEQNAIKLQENTDKTIAIEASVAENTTVTNQVKADTGEIVELFQSGKAFFRVLGAIGDFLLKCAELVAKVARPVGYIAAAVGAVIGAYAAWKSGTPHIGPKP